MDLKGKKVTIIGAGRSGMAAAKLVLSQGGLVRLTDERDLAEFDQQDKQWIQDSDIETEFNAHSEDFIENSDLVVLSPGVKVNSPVVQWAKAKNIDVISEVELASQFCRRPIIAVTGSNGKTTVVTLLRDVLGKAGKKVCLCGNIGSPFSEHVLDLQSKDFVVLEVSSFQLETIVKFKPYIAVLLNISENHLDRHQSMDEYVELKKRLFANQTSSDFAVLNAKDHHIKSFVQDIPSRTLFFNNPQSTNGTHITNPNLLAVLEVAKILGINTQICQDVFNDFKGVEHRLEWVCNIDGIDFVNDSKSTTAEAGRWAIESIEKPIVLICGGRDKNIDFSTLADIVEKKVRKIYVIGEAKSKIKEAFCDLIDVEECDVLETAVQKSRESAHEGECVILSPMCTSFDMFANFEERGATFKSIVLNLKAHAR